MFKRITTWKYSYLLPIVALVTPFFIIYSYYSIYKHQTYNSSAFDLGIYIQLIHLYTRNLFPLSTLGPIEQGHVIHLGIHFEPIMILLTPISFLPKSPELLLIIQAFCVAFSALPIYLIATDKLKDRFLSFLLTFCYLISPGILSAVNFDFHPSTLALLPLTLILYSWYFKKWKLYWMLILVALLFKEDIPILLLSLGLYQIIKKQFKIGIATLSLGLSTFYLVKFLIMPFIWPSKSGMFINESSIPIFLILSGHLELIYKVFTDSILKIVNLIVLYQQYAFLALFSLFNLVIVVPYIFLRYSDYSYTNIWTPYWHYNASLEPFLVVSTIFGLSLLRLSKNYSYFLLIFFLIINQLFYIQYVWLPLKAKDNHLNSYGYINSALKIIPANVSVSAGSALVPHLANREKIYLYPEVYDAQYIILDTRLDPFTLSTSELKNKILTLKSSKNWKLEKEDQSLFIFKKIY